MVRHGSVVFSFIMGFVLLTGLFSLAAAASPTLYISDRPSGGPYNRVVIDPATGSEVTAMALSAEPGEMAACPDGTRV